MKTNDRRIIKCTQVFNTAEMCYADDVWFIPLQPENAEKADVDTDSGSIDNHGYPYLMITHPDDYESKKKNYWDVTFIQKNHDDVDVEEFKGSFKTAQLALSTGCGELVDKFSKYTACMAECNSEKEYTQTLLYLETNEASTVFIKTVDIKTEDNSFKKEVYYLDNDSKENEISLTEEDVER
jgi:hypothetical protein